MDKSFTKGLRLLEALIRSEGPRGVTELASELGIVKSNAHRLLQTLVALGYVRQAPSAGSYEPTLKVWELGSSVIARLDLKRVASPHLRKLAWATKETVNLSILDGHEVVYIDKVDSPQPVRANSRIGGRALAYCSSTGKCLLAHQEPAALRGLEKGLRRMSDGRPVSHEWLQAELAQVRRRGFAMNLGEISTTVYGVGAPIFGPDGLVAAAVGVAGPGERMKKSVLLKLAPLVRRTAAEISAALGGAAP